MSSNLYISALEIKCNARALFAQISHKPWAMLLDSGTSDHIDANIDIIVQQPIITLTTEGNTTTIENFNTNTSEQSTDNPFDIIESQLQRCGLTRLPSSLPFSGGALGYFSYDLARRCERLSDNATRDIALPEMAVGIYQHVLIFDHRLNTWTLASRSSRQQHQDKLAATLELASTGFISSASQDELSGVSSAWSHQMSKQAYAAKFDQIQQHLRQGDCYQINLTQRFKARHHGDEYQTYLKLANKNNTPFSAFIRLPDAAILSVSPERFIQCYDGNIEAKPIKGTRPRSNDSLIDKQLATELRASEKDQSENLMIVDLLRNDIGRSAQPGSVKVPQLFAIESFKNVHHLVSTIKAKLAHGVVPTGLLKQAFPGGSITGAPKISAMNIIDELEPSRRSIYCGSIGYVSLDQQMDTNITIRTLLCIDDYIYCWAGGGIVADSQVDEEYQECFDKVASIMPLLAPAKPA